MESFGNTELTIKNRELSYKTPLVTFIYSMISIIVFFLVFPGETPVAVILVVGFAYIFFYYAGMYKRYKSNMNEYRGVVESNVDFIKICITPISIIITFLGFLYTATGSITAINSDSFWVCLEYYNNAFNALGSLAGIVVYKVAVWLIGRMVLVLFLGYIFSIPVQIASYLILQFLVYNTDYFQYYSKLWHALHRRKKHKSKNKKDGN
jgi:hypothetical protein